MSMHAVETIIMQQVTFQCQAKSCDTASKTICDVQEQGVRLCIIQEPGGCRGCNEQHEWKTHWSQVSMLLQSFPNTWLHTH